MRPVRDRVTDKVRDGKRERNNLSKRKSKRYNQIDRETEIMELLRYRVIDKVRERERESWRIRERERERRR